MAQKYVLEEEFEKENVWSFAKQKRLSKQLGVSVSKIYKWNWDKRNKRQNQQLD
jgi:hypothetical protein